MKVEITPEMLEAGSREVANYSPDFETYAEGAALIYTAMRALEPMTVTQEMIDAGVGVLIDYDPDWDSSEAFLVKVYAAMEEARQQQGAK